MSRFRGLIALAVSALCGSALALGDGKLHMYFVDIGQGDATLIIGPQGTSVLVDGGPSNTPTPIVEAMNDAIAAGLTDNTLDYVVCSHFHADHLAALETFAQQFPGGIVAAYDRGGARSITAFTQYDDYFGAPGLNKRKFAETFSIGTGCTMTYVGKASAGDSDENNNGVIYVLEFGAFRCSLGGDLGGSQENSFAAAIGDVDHYKANHHGSGTSSQQNFLNVILPQTHTFSYSVGNSFGHPHSEAVTRLQAIGSTRYDTVDHAAAGPYVALVTDGVSTYQVNGVSYTLANAPPPPAAQVVINEALPAPSSGSSEWVELYNPGSTSVDLTGWKLDDLIGGGGAAQSLSGSIAPGAFLVISNTAALNNTSDDINLINASGTVVDTTSYSSPAYDTSWARNPDGTGAFAWDSTPTPGAANAAAAPTAPAAPSGLSASSISSTQIDLAWTDNSSNESNFVVSRSSTSGGPYTDIATLGSNVTSYPDTGLSASTTYYYVVRATNAAGASGNSNQASATTQAPAAVLKINEALPAPSSGSEWVEIYNAGTTTVDLTGWQLDDLIGGGGAAQSLSGSIAPGAFLVISNNAALNNTGDDINLINPSGTVVDTTTYPSPAYDTSWARNPDGTGAFAWDSTPTPGSTNTASAPGPTAPAAPSGLSATAASSSQINLAWTDNSSDESDFVVSRSATAGGSYTDIATLAAGTTSYSNTGLAASTAYYYVVRAVNSAGSSANSNEASATTQAPSSIDVHVSAISMNWVKSGKKYKARAVVTIKDASGNPINGATVTGSFTGAISESGATAATGSNGQATITSTGSTSSGTVTFTVTNVTGTGLSYNSTANGVTSASISR